MVTGDARISLLYADFGQERPILSEAVGGRSRYKIKPGGTGLIRGGYLVGPLLSNQEVSRIPEAGSSRYGMIDHETKSILRLLETNKTAGDIMGKSTGQTLAGYRWIKVINGCCFLCRISQWMFYSRCRYIHLFSLISF